MAYLHGKLQELKWEIALQARQVSITEGLVKMTAIVHLNLHKPQGDEINELH